MSKTDEVVASILESFSTLRLFIKEIDKLETRLTKCKKNKRENEDLVIEDIANVIDKIQEHSIKIKDELDTHPAAKHKKKKKTGDALTEDALKEKCKKDKTIHEKKKDEVDDIDGKEVDKKNNDDIHASEKSSTCKATTRGKKTKTNDEPNTEKENQSDVEGSEKSENSDDQDKVKNGEKVNRSKLQNHKNDENSDNETCTNSNEDKEDTDVEEENDRIPKNHSDPLRSSNSPVCDNDMSDNQKAEESTKLNEEVKDTKPQIRLVDLNKLIDPKPKKSVKFDSSLIIISSDEEHSPKKQSTDNNGRLKSALKNSPSKIAKSEYINEKIKDEIKTTKKRGHQEDDDLSGSDSDIKVVSDEGDSGRRRSSRVQRNKSKVIKRQEDLKKIFKRKGNKNGNSSFEIVNDRSNKKQKLKDLMVKLSSGSSSAGSDSDEDEEKTSRKNRSKGKQCSAPAPDDKSSRKLYVPLPLVECDKLKEVYLRNKEILEIKRLTSLTSLKKKRHPSLTESEDTDSNEECGKPTSKKSKTSPSVGKRKKDSDKKDSSAKKESSDEKDSSDDEILADADKSSLNTAKESDKDVGKISEEALADIAMETLEHIDEAEDVQESKDSSDSDVPLKKKGKISTKKSDKNKKNNADGETGEKSDEDKESKDEDDEEKEVNVDQKKKQEKQKDAEDTGNNKSQVSCEEDTAVDNSEEDQKAQNEDDDQICRAKASNSGNKNQEDDDDDKNAECDILDKVVDESWEEESSLNKTKKILDDDDDTDKDKNKENGSDGEENNDDEKRKGKNDKNKKKVDEISDEENHDKKKKGKINKKGKKVDESDDENSSETQRKGKIAKEKVDESSEDSGSDEKKKGKITKNGKSVSKSDDDEDDNNTKKKKDHKKNEEDESDTDTKKKGSHSASEEEDSTDKNVAKNKINSDEDDSDDEKKKKKKKWRNDKLLTNKIDSTDTEEEHTTHKKKEKKDSDSDDDEPVVKKPTRRTRRTKKIVLSDSDESSKDKKSKDSSNEDSEQNSDSSDSNVKKKKQEEEPKKKTRRIKRAKDSSSDDDDKSTRKHIRGIIDRSALSESTIKAEEEEKQRKARIAEKQKKYNAILEDVQNSKVEKLILEYDEKKQKDLLPVHKHFISKLKPHQANGVRFMWDACFESIERCSKEGSGCILAHCMGLGKTLQVITLTHTLLTNSEKTGVNRVMVVCPINTVLNWKSEYKMWMPKNSSIEVYELVNCKLNSERQYYIKEWFEEGGVLIIGYTMFRMLSNPDNKKIPKKFRTVFQEGLVDPGPDLVVCDEGHLLKNEKTNLSIAMNRIRTKRRIVLTGTPLQNNLKEYWCMVQFIKPNLLGTYKEYLNRFVNPITNGQYTDSTQHDIVIMRKRSHVLHKLLDGVVQRRDYSVLEPYLPPKHEYVIFVKLCDVQIKLYKHYMERMARKGDGVSNRTSFLFTDFQNLQRICTHPRALQYKNYDKKELLDSDEEESAGSLKDFIDDGAATSTGSSSSSSSGSDSEGSDREKTGGKSKYQQRTRVTRAQAAQRRENNEESDPELEEIKKEWWQEYCDGDELDNINNSGKLYLLFQILKECEEIGDKVLVFSQSLITLNVIEYFLEKVDEATQNGDTAKIGGLSGSWSLGLDYFRLDGSSSCDNRATWCNVFNNPDNTRARLFLISTKAGGLGINLVAANRVIIFDVSWNPSHDIQSIYRVYRFGQTKPCYIYRFVTYGAMEMKIYERQVTKQAISKRVIDEQQIDRHYNQNDLQELYKCEVEPEEERPIPLVPKDVLLGELLQKLDQTIYKYHLHQSLLENKTDEGLNEEERKAAWEEFESEKVLRKTTSTWNAMGVSMGLPQLPMNAQTIAAALTNIVRKDNPTWSEIQIKGIIPALVRQLQVQMSENDMSMYTRVLQEIEIMQAALRNQMTEAMYQQQVMRAMQEQQRKNLMMGNPQRFAFPGNIINMSHLQRPAAPPSTSSAVIELND